MSKETERLKKQIAELEEQSRILQSHLTTAMAQRDMLISMCNSIERHGDLPDNWLWDWENRKRENGWTS